LRAKIKSISYSDVFFDMSLPSHSTNDEQGVVPADPAKLPTQPDQNDILKSGIEYTVSPEQKVNNENSLQPERVNELAANAASAPEGNLDLTPLDHPDNRPHSLVVFIKKYLPRNASEPSRALVVQEAQMLASSVITAFQKSQAPSLLRRHGLFLACVVLPSLLATIYFGLYASDIYVSESSYVVRSPNKKSSASGLGAMLEGAGFSGFSKAPDDVYTVSEYVRSRDALSYLQNQLDLKNIWQSGKVDILHRFNPLGWDGSQEALYEYYLKRVETHVDSMSGITSLKVSAFDPETSFQINTLLVSEAERLVNILNERGRNDLIRFAENEVRHAEEKAKASALALSNYRNEQSVMDPVRQTQLHYEHISRLQEELVKTRTQLTQLKVFSPKSPHPPALELREKTLENEVAKEMQKITGGENSLASKAAEYERLTLEREFADKQLASALVSLEVARNEAQRQQLYLETIAKPILPDEAVLPKRFRGILSTVVLGLISWGILSMLLAGVREHQY
jgi:capsular polysaccharide transport system permease protein